MSAKHPKKSAKRESAASPAAVAVPVTGSSVNAEVTASWIDSTDPRKRTFGKIVLVALWVYVAALWLLALDQTFHWGIFGPKVPPAV